MDPLKIFRREYWITDEDLEEPVTERRWRQAEIRVERRRPPSDAGERERERLRHPWLTEQASELQGRLDAVRQERDALRAQVAELLDEREHWVALLQYAMAGRDVVERAWQQDREAPR
jgi:hypothetical protein